MEFEYPFILVAKKSFLEALQHGDLYLVNCMHYHKMENDDAQRGDIFDSAIKCSYEGYDIPDELKRNTKYGKLFLLTTYIKCFFHYKDEDVKRLSDNLFECYISDTSANELKSFNEEYALIIYDAPLFIKRFSTACEKLKAISNYYFSDVTYIDDEEYLKYEADLINGLLGKETNNVTHPAFIKRKKYSSQQEFRIVVSLPIGEPPENAVGIKLPESIDFSMEGIEDISAIVKLSDLIEKPLTAKVISSIDMKGERIEYYL